MKELGFRMFVLVLSILPGLLVGWFLNMTLYIFHAIILGWGDSAPDWYVAIQSKVIFSLFAIAVIACMYISQQLYRRKFVNMKTIE